MHIQPLPRQYQVVLDTNEIKAIQYGLSLHMFNAGTTDTNKELIAKMLKQFNNAVTKQTP
jgi:hypothetical protein